MNTSPFTMGWLMAMFDLPVTTEDERRAATRFRNDLLEDGFLMIQYSVYARPCVHFEQMQKHAERIRKIAPRAGNVRIFFVTDQQWVKSINIVGERPFEDETSASSNPSPTKHKDRRSRQKHIPGQIEFWE